mgnify:CR=1 FL=1|tara:strand:+ start:233 stop:682 length:450 start_codon:yes stop_codon:yes gene_type:complete
MELSRRSFLIGVASVAAATAAGPALARLGIIADDLPILHGDGVTDDWPAFDALMQGRWARSPTGIIFKEPIIVGGVYFVSKTLTVSAHDFLLAHLQIKTTGDPMLCCLASTLGRIEECVFTGLQNGLSGVLSSGIQFGLVDIQKVAEIE